MPTTLTPAAAAKLVFETGRSLPMLTYLPNLAHYRPLRHVRATSVRMRFTTTSASTHKSDWRNRSTLRSGPLAHWAGFAASRARMKYAAGRSESSGQTEKGTGKQNCHSGSLYELNSSDQAVGTQ